VQPEFTDDHVLEMQGGRHPIIEAALGSAYVPTDVELSGDECRAGIFTCALHVVMLLLVLRMLDSTVLLTGPNMSGKSTALRTLACLVIMAQCGACVPALSLRLSVCDAVHVRAGAGDDILGHRSTFMLEMRDAARILNSVTSRSLVILDELGRGTSTHDGAAIADAALQHLLGVKCFTLFATHYPQLGRLANRHLRNVHPAFVADAAGRVIFLYKLVQGICPYSFGLNVATLAGVPDSVVQRAAERAQQMRRVTEGQHWLRNLSDSVSHADAAALRSLCSELKLIIESDHA
jgi:DNA mismatch repair ATPase MutS